MDAAPAQTQTSSPQTPSLPAAPSLQAAPSQAPSADAQALDDTSVGTPRAPKWNKQKAIAESCTEWATGMLDVHKEAEKVASVRER